VLAIQRKLSALGYWLGPDNGIFGDSTQQAVYALQKAAGIERDGIVGPETQTALKKGIVPVPQPTAGNVIEIDLEDDLIMFVDNGKLVATLNCSTGGGYTFSTGSGTALAVTPRGVFHTFRLIDGNDTDSLGTLWRPRFFSGPYAIHGDSYVPPYPVSHGCVRVSDEAIDWIWSENLDPLGMEVWVF
jgi:lipoprotein-anchoring transpeptidase ErfK/SrfK